MILLLAFLWPFGSGIEQVNCGPYSHNPYSANCEIVLADGVASHQHTLIATFSDGTRATEQFTGPVHYVRMPAPALTLQNVRLAGKLADAKPPTGRALARRVPASVPVGIPVPVP
jgi:hypothetical protein